MKTNELTSDQMSQIIHLIMPWYESYARISIPESDLDPIINICCEVYDLIPFEVQINTREERIRECRQVIHFISKLATPYSLNFIGDAVGKRDHATVIHSHKSVANLYDTDKEFRRNVDDICVSLDISENDLRDYLSKIRRRLMSIAS